MFNKNVYQFIKTNKLEPGNTIKVFHRLFRKYMILISVDDHYLYGYSIINHINKNMFQYQYYELDKHVYVDLRRFIKIPKLYNSYKVSNIDEAKLRRINHLISIATFRGCTNLKQSNGIHHIKFYKGDIFNIDNNNYYAYRIKNNYLIMFEVTHEKHLNNPSKCSIQIDNINYTVHLDNYCKFMNIQNLPKQVIAYCNEKQIRDIDLSFAKLNNHVRAGAVFKKNNTFFLTYQIKDNQALCFKLYHADTINRTSIYRKTIQINQNKYHIFLNEKYEIKLRNYKSSFYLDDSTFNEIKEVVMSINQPLSSGSIIQKSENHYFLVHKFDGEEIYGYQIKNYFCKKSHIYPITLNNQQFYLYCNNYKKLSKPNYYLLIDHIQNHSFKIKILFLLSLRQKSLTIVETNKEKNYKFIEQNNITCSHKQQLIFDELIEGDVVYAKMPFPNSKLNKIEKTHQIRPYVVLKILENSIVALQCSSNKFKGWTKYMNYYFISQDTYLQNKNSFIDVTKTYIIPKSNLSSRLFYLNDNDWFSLEKRIVAMKLPGYHELISSNINDIEIEYGDIFIYEDQYWYAYEIHENSIVACMVLEKKNHKLIIEDGNRYFKLTDTFKQIPMQNASSIIAILPKTIVHQIDKAIDIYLKQNNISTFV